MGDGPPRFQQDSTCPAVLRILLRINSISNTRLLLSLANPSRLFFYGVHNLYCSPTTPKCKHFGLPFCRFARRYSGNRICFLFLQLLRCFSSLRIPLLSLTDRSTSYQLAGSPIRKSLDQRSLTTSQSISLFVTSFFGS